VRRRLLWAGCKEQAASISRSLLKYLMSVELFFEGFLATET